MQILANFSKCTIKWIIGHSFALVDLIKFCFDLAEIWSLFWVLIPAVFHQLYHSGLYFSLICNLRNLGSVWIVSTLCNQGDHICSKTSHKWHSTVCRPTAGVLNTDYFNASVVFDFLSVKSVDFKKLMTKCVPVFVALSLHKSKQITFKDQLLPFGVSDFMKYGIALYRISCNTIAKLNTWPSLVPQAGLKYPGIRNNSGAVHSCFLYFCYSSISWCPRSSLLRKCNPNDVSLICQRLSTRQLLLRMWPWEPSAELWR